VTEVPQIKLNNGLTIPQIGLGLWQNTDEKTFLEAFDAAVDVGYRHFDSAQAYNNEHFLGKAWQRSGIKREELFLTTKINIRNFGKNHLIPSVEQSLINLQTDYVDLFLLHFPVSLFRKNAWQQLVEVRDSGKAKSIGVSNYTIRHLEEMAEYSDIEPVVNQVELHVFLQQPELIEYCLKRGIVVEAYSPLARSHEMDNAVISQISAKHGKSYAQIMLRWLIEQGLVVIPKSVHANRIKENFQIFDFELDSDDLAEIKALDKEMRTCWSPVHVP